MSLNTLKQELLNVLSRLHEQLWLKPLVICLLSILTVTLASLVDGKVRADWAPEISVDSLKALLQVMSGSMLVVATFAVGSMVSAYASASNAATPRSFPLVVSDDMSQNAMSTFIGAFIFSVVALLALNNSLFGDLGRLILFVITLGVFVLVILMLIAWVDSIARLGRLHTVVEKAEQATSDALKLRADRPTLGAAEVDTASQGELVFAEVPGFVQRVSIEQLQSWAEKYDAQIELLALPGTFATPNRPLLRVEVAASVLDIEALRIAFTFGRRRTFREDPRFGLTVLSEIASRALSPAVNDPGTAIEVTGVLLRLLLAWDMRQVEGAKTETPDYPRVRSPRLAALDLFDDAFTGIARDGAGMVEVQVRLQKALATLKQAQSASMREAAVEHSRRALARCELALTLPDDVLAVRRAAQGSTPQSAGEGASAN